MPEPLKILGIAGSLRKASLNRGLLRAAASMMPEGATLTIAEYGDLPPYDADLVTDEGPPAAVQRFIDAIGRADGVLIATPEYNYSVPGVLKNAIDWASRPAYRSVFAGKDVAVMSAAPGMLGGVRAQAHLKSILLGMAARPFPHPEVCVPRAADKLAGDRITDEVTAKFVQQLLDAFCGWLRSNRG